MDFIHEWLDEGRPNRILNIVDDFTCETLCSYAAFSFGSSDVIREIEKIALFAACPIHFAAITVGVLQSQDASLVRRHEDRAVFH